MTPLMRDPAALTCVEASVLAEGTGSPTGLLAPVGGVVPQQGRKTRGANAAACETDAVDPDAFAALVAAGAREDPAALSQLWIRYAPAVTAFVRGKGSRQPEELTSEVFLGLFRELPRFSGDEAGFKALAFTIARRRVVDELRSRSRKVPTVDWDHQSDHDLDGRAAPSAEDTALGTIGSLEARKLLQKLAPDQRDVLMLRIFGDLTVDEVAGVLGKRSGAVKALQRRGLESLRRMLAETHGERPEEVTPWELHT